MLDGWLGFAFALVSASLGVVGVAWSVVGQWGLKRRTLSLEFDVADLQERLLREIKSRAGREGVKAKKEDEEFEKAVRTNATKGNSSPQPWWNQYVHQDLKQ